VLERDIRWLLGREDGHVSGKDNSRTYWDASVSWIGVPFALEPPDSELYAMTVRRVRDEPSRPRGRDTFVVRLGGRETIRVTARAGQHALL
jgi:hypothetical protein